jgi:hypothetical protein
VKLNLVEEIVESDVKVRLFEGEKVFVLEKLSFVIDCDE